VVDRVVFGSGTVIARMAHAHLRHGGPFEASARCHGHGRWEPATDFGLLVSDGPRLVEDSAQVQRFLVP